MFKRKNGQMGAVAVTLAIVFTIGLVLGTVALFYVPEDITLEAIEAFGMKENASFGELFKENLAFEMMWMLILWMLGSSAVTAPFTGAVMSLRGFVIGFSISFMIAGELDRIKLFLCRILPQCVTALPVMSIFILTCVMYASEKKHKDNYQTGYFLRGALFMIITALSSICETWIMMLVEKFY